MHTTLGRRSRPIIKRVVMLAVTLSLGGTMPVARAATVGISPVTPPTGQVGVAPVEPGWPGSHQISSDPRPGESGYIAPFATLVAPPDGMTDAQMAASDPAALAALMPERDAIERSLLPRAREEAKAEGVAPGEDSTMSPEQASAVSAALAAKAVSPYGYLRFTLTPNTTSPHARNGYLGTLYFIYGIYNPTVDAYKWYTVSWPARSGNNRPASQKTAGVGPIPEYRWTFGFANGSWRGYEPDGRVEFGPGKWRLDPWTGGPYNRGLFEVHGGTGAHEYGPTSGCIRLYPGAISTLKTYYDTKMANKRDAATARLTVAY